jgi:hypothetical protein
MNFYEAIDKARSKVASRIGIARFDMIHVLAAPTHRQTCATSG